MRECHEAVAALLDAFSRGISIIRTQKSVREKERRKLDPSHKVAESELKKTLKKSRTDVEIAYGRDVARLGPGFAVGDAEARTSLSSILVRINAGFLSVVERFMRGCSSPADYQALVNLSNSSRVETIHTFEQLSQRLSRSSLVIAPPRMESAEAARGKQKSKTKQNSPTITKQQRHVRSKSAPELSLTPLGPATASGWVRPKPGRKLSSESRYLSTSTNANTLAIKRPSPKSSRRALPSSQTAARQTPISTNPHSLPQSHPNPRSHTTSPPRQSPPPAYHPPSPLQPSPSPSLIPPTTTTTPSLNRNSLLSFTSDSTKLGEIPLHKWTRQPLCPAGQFSSERDHFVDPNEEIQFPIRPCYPLKPYREPEKRVGRLRRLFGRG